MEALRKTPRSLGLAFLCVSAGLGSCGWGPFATEVPQPNPCDPASSLYIKKQHYIARDFVTEDGTVDYARWFESRKVQSSPCDPVAKGNSVETREPKSSVPTTVKEPPAPMELQDQKSP